jgi:transposase InsO family protein
MKEHKGRYGAAKMAGVFGVSRSGYYAWEQREASPHKKGDEVLAGIITKLFKDHRKRYGSPRIWAELKGLGIRVGRKRVERLMRREKRAARRRRKGVYTTDSCHNLAVAENILNRDFLALFPGEKWVSDITYVRTKEGWLYLTVILDLYDRKAIGWSISGELTAGPTCCRALDMAVGNRTPRERLIVHSDRGVQYCSYATPIALTSNIAA